jgi:F-type H+-transporting ATPase subunit gamma
MAGLKELRTRIEGVKSTSKITSAMKMVSASKFRRAQLTLERSESFQKMLEDNIKKVLYSMKRDEVEKGIKYILPNTMLQPQNPKKYLLFVLASDRGLCGSYNSMVAKEAIKRIDELKQQGKEVVVISYGKKATAGLRRYGYTDIKEEYTSVIKRHLTYGEALQFLYDVWHKKKKYHADICEIVYSDFLSGLSREYLSKQVFPYDLGLSLDDVDLDKVGDSFYWYEPNKVDVLSDLASLYIRSKMFEILINSQASEHAARMSSMDNANRNAEDMINSLTFKYNSLRQSAITTELVEIVAGAEAM